MRDVSSSWVMQRKKKPQMEWSGNKKLKINVVCSADGRKWRWIWYLVQCWGASNIGGNWNGQILRGRSKPLIRYRDFTRSLSGEKLMVTPAASLLQGEVFLPSWFIEKKHVKGLARLTGILGRLKPRTLKFLIYFPSPGNSQSLCYGVWLSSELVLPPHLPKGLEFASFF